MPVTVAERRGPCAACVVPIEVGELMTYTLEQGPRHMACTDRTAESRRNVYAGPCHLCGERVRVKQGSLEVVERVRSDGSFDRKWLVSCLDVAACDARIRATR